MKDWGGKRLYRKKKKKRKRGRIRERTETDRQTDRHLKAAGASVAREQLVKDCSSPIAGLI